MPKTLKEFEGEPDIYYETGSYGLLPKAVMDMMELRDNYKARRKNAKTEEEYRKWDSAQMATKRAVNAFYGILAKDGYAWGDMEMAKSITASARFAMRSVAFKAQELGYKVIYGHTDSIFVQVKDVEDAQNLRHILNMYISQEIFREPVELEFEKFASKFFLAAKKNRYCGWLSWKDGEYLDKEKFMVMGFEMKKSNETKLAKEFQETLLKMVSKGKTHKEIIDYCNKIYAKVVKGQVELREISKRSRLRRNLEDYDMIAGGTAGIMYYNQQEVGDVKIEKGDSYYFFKMDNSNLDEQVYLVNGVSKSAEYIAFRKFSEVENFKPDWSFIAQAEVIKKSALILESMGWSTKEYKRDVNQTTLDGWW
jgi:DNA polymerase elongation subunit (family B)